MMRELIGSPVQISVGQLLVFKADRNRVGSQLGLLLEQLLQTRVLSIGFVCLIPLDEKLSTLVFRYQGVTLVRCVWTTRHLL